jgi:DNA-binding NarL/FixJ family response regulator
MLSSDTYPQRLGLPPLLAAALNDLATQLLRHRFRVDLTGSDGRTARVHPTPSASRSGMKQVLTAGEWRIAAMVANGSTNREIAQTLNISPKTVEAHLSHIYRKASVRSRSQLAVLIALDESNPSLNPTVVDLHPVKGGRS